MVQSLLIGWRMMSKNFWLALITVAACGTSEQNSDEPGEESPDGKGDGAAAGAYLLNESFNAMATGSMPDGKWAPTASGTGSVTITEVPFAADKSAKVSKSDPSGAASLESTFKDQSGRIVFEAKVLA